MSKGMEGIIQKPEFGYAGLLNDFNILNLSPLLESLVD
jgi:hypothetical protein